MKPISMTRALKPLLIHKGVIRKITKMYDNDTGQYFYNIHLKRGQVSRYDDKEVNITDCNCTGNMEEDVKEIDSWLDEILYTREQLQKVIGDGYRIEWL